MHEACLTKVTNPPLVICSFVILHNISKNVYNFCRISFFSFKKLLEILRCHIHPSFAFFCFCRNRIKFHFKMISITRMMLIDVERLHI